LEPALRGNLRQVFYTNPAGFGVYWVRALNHQFQMGTIYV
jgi:hypothetical protein